MFIIVQWTFFHFGILMLFFCLRMLFSSGCMLCFGQSSFFCLTTQRRPSGWRVWCQAEALDLPVPTRTTQVCMQKQNYTDLESGSVRQLLWMQWGVEVCWRHSERERERTTFVNNVAHSVDLITKCYSERATERHCTLDNYNKFQTLLRWHKSA